MVAVVGFGYHRKADAGDAQRGWHRSRLCTSSWRGTGKPSEPDLVWCSLLVGRELRTRDVRGLAGSFAWMRLLVLAVPELHQRLVVQAQPRDVACSAARAGGVDWNSTHAVARVADEFVASVRPVPVVGRALAIAQVIRQQRVRSARVHQLDALLALCVFVDHGDTVGRRCCARVPSEGHVFASAAILRFDGDVFEHMARARCVVRRNETARFAMEQPCSASPGKACDSAFVT